MSIREQIEDTVTLFTQRRYRGAFLNAVIAVAATARKRRSRDEAKDHESFVAFLREEMGVVTGGGVWNYTVAFRNKEVRLEQVLYEFVRCALAHEATLPPDVVIDDSVPLGELLLGLTDGRLTLSATWVDGLVRAAWFAPENASEFPEWTDLPEQEMRRHLFGSRWNSANAQEYWRARSARIAALSKSV